MAGHSKWANIKHKKAAADAKRGKIFTRLIKEITVAARLGGADIGANPRLRLAVDKAREQNMPKDTIDNAIKRGSGQLDGVAYEEVRYEGYGPGGVALIVEALTDNRNRTASEIRSAFSKGGGALGETNSVSFMFERGGDIAYPASAASADAMFEAGLEAGASNVESGTEGHEIVTTLDDFAQVRDALEAKFGAAERAKLAWRPTTMVPVDDATAESLFKLIETLEDNDDVQTVWGNYEVSDAVLQKLAG